VSAIGRTSFSCEACSFDLCPSCAEVPIPKPKPKPERKEYCRFCGARVQDGRFCEQPLVTDEFAQREPGRKTCSALWSETTQAERSTVTRRRDAGLPRYSVLDLRAEPQISESESESEPTSEPAVEAGEPSPEPALAPAPAETPAALWQHAVVQFVQKGVAPGLRNAAGAPMQLGDERGQAASGNVFYCGRRLGRREIPGSDGTCGPSYGPQCADCLAYQPAPGDCRLEEVTVTLDLSAEAKAFLAEVALLAKDPFLCMPIFFLRDSRCKAEWSAAGT
jgi:hypothetical protein